MTNIEQVKIKNKSYILETIGNNFSGEFYQTIKEDLILNIRKESDTTERRNWTELILKLFQTTEDLETLL